MYLPTKKTPGPDDFTGEFCKTFKKEIILVLHKIFHKTEKKEHIIDLDTFYIIL